MESSIPILHTSHPSTGKCSGSKKNWHQTRNHPFTFTSFTWNLEGWSWKRVECRPSWAESARHRFSAPAAPHFWPQLLQIFGHSCCCSRFLTLLQECEGRQGALSGPPAGQLSNMRRKNSSPDVIWSEGPDDQSDSYWLATGMEKHSKDQRVAIKWLCHLVPFSFIHQH